METTPVALPKLASVILPCCNQLADTRLCVAALLRHTRPPWELVAIDNGSTDGTAAYLAGVQDAAPLPVQIITNPSNRGFPAACNQGLAAARGNYLVLLNNDTVPTDAWLDQLSALADSDPAIGMVGPMSNVVSGPQLVPLSLPYADLAGLHRFAAQWRAEHRGQWFLTERLVGFCLLLKRQVWERVGGLDERFGLGLFDDDDLSLRVRRAGFTLAVAHDLFVHHFGSRTFAGLEDGGAALLRENRARFLAKWGGRTSGGHAMRAENGLEEQESGARECVLPDAEMGAEEGRAGGTPALPGRAEARGQRAGGTPALPAEEAGGTPALPADEKSGTAALPGTANGRPKVSLTMIVRDEEANLPACLESAKGLFDELVIVDTGSTDRTPELARSFGARVFDFVWVDDFAAARNAALAHARGQWAFWLDADDRIDPLERRSTLPSSLPCSLRSGSPWCSKKSRYGIKPAATE